MLESITDKNPEKWLNDTRIMQEMIIDKVYLAEINSELEKINGVRWHRALEKISLLIKYIVYDDNCNELKIIKSKDKKRWQTKIYNSAIKNKPMAFQDCALFWIAQYSLLSALPMKRIKFSDVKHCPEYCKQTGGA
jgi:hypothetical protein